ncbi:biotin/lipoyl-containing protein [Enterococcus timonensis]|uniref:biotin/lipoyl-containing protein n=1 Tax=Enterococcus timonensis TaxID=1852364 RepID=UPI0008D9460F|nr:biotin/lipoyl-containing protein [Enterococcus timonensis]
MLRKFKINIDGKEYLVEMEEITEGGQPVNVAAGPVAPVAPVTPVTTAAPVAPVTPTAPASVPKTTSGKVMRAPMPGTILKILVESGSSVKKNQPLLILEAMKMENEIVAEEDAVIGEIFVIPNQVVKADDVLLSFS